MVCVHSNLLLPPIFALIRCLDPSQVGNSVCGANRAGQMMTKREIKPEVRKNMWADRNVPGPENASSHGLSAVPTEPSPSWLNKAGFLCGLKTSPTVSPSPEAGLSPEVTRGDRQAVCGVTAFLLLSGIMGQAGLAWP